MYTFAQFFVSDTPSVSIFCGKKSNRLIAISGNFVNNVQQTLEHVSFFRYLAVGGVDIQFEKLRRKKNV